MSIVLGTFSRTRMLHSNSAVIRLERVENDVQMRHPNQREKMGKLIC